MRAAGVKCKSFQIISVATDCTHTVKADSKGQTESKLRAEVWAEHQRYSGPPHSGRGEYVFQTLGAAKRRAEAAMAVLSRVEEKPYVFSAGFSFFSRVSLSHQGSLDMS